MALEKEIAEFITTGHPQIFSVSLRVWHYGMFPEEREVNSGLR
ncbi:TPA: hypothetical protein ACRZH1_003181 [Escherichia coli]